jgi:hypothetical protein
MCNNVLGVGIFTWYGFELRWTVLDTTFCKNVVLSNSLYLYYTPLLPVIRLLILRLLTAGIAAANSSHVGYLPTREAKIRLFHDENARSATAQSLGRPSPSFCLQRFAKGAHWHVPQGVLMGSGGNQRGAWASGRSRSLPVPKSGEAEMEGKLAVFFGKRKGRHIGEKSHFISAGHVRIVTTLAQLLPRGL